MSHNFKKRINQIISKYSQASERNNMSSYSASNLTLITDSDMSSEYRIVNGLRTFDYNPDGRCGSAAAAILLAYYDDEVDDAIVDDVYLSDSTGEAFTNYLYYHIEGLIPSSFAEDVRNGLNWYLEEVEYDDIYYATVVSNATFSEFYNLIFDDSPVIIDLDDHPTYGEHWVVGYGTDMRMYSDSFISGIISFAIVNDGWGSNEIMINWDYVCDIVYLYER